MVLKNSDQGKFYQNKGLYASQEYQALWPKTTEKIVSTLEPSGQEGKKKKSSVRRWRRLPLNMISKAVSLHYPNKSTNNRGRVKLN